MITHVLLCPCCRRACARALLTLLWVLTCLGACGMIVAGTAQDWWFHGAGLYICISAVWAWRSTHRRQCP